MKKMMMIALLPFALVACGGTDEKEPDTEALTDELVEVPEEIPQPMYVPDTSAEQVIQDYMAANNLTGERHESGMYIVTEKPGTGEDRPDLLDDVTIYYTGKLLDGTVFDGTESEPATFPLSNLIVGWQIGIPYFGEGGKGKLIIPPGLAYGDRANGDIPANSTLMFEIEVVSFAKSKKQQMFF
jgi:FKBP-type peptidyl-prolyl cis-trans isomerase